MYYQQSNISPGDKVDNYSVIEQLGAGAAATVYRVHEAGTGHVRALKVLGPSALADENMQQRFIRKITAM